MSNAIQSKPDDPIISADISLANVDQRPN